MRKKIIFKSFVSICGLSLLRRYWILLLVLFLFVIDCVALEEVNKDFTQENVEDIISSFIANDCENPICFEYDDDRETIIKKVKSGRYDDSLFRSIGKEMEENLKTHLAQFISSKFYGMSA
eukprot:TRINITY_DN33_c0_g1_i13.p2 TRINITY_DN33_c0_g1~~TRINITY_DN33_c0_g1_i13.p2  ORF type:complete len:121 (-),score=21.04 TRINITY_DN33_c0_g1_i13:87-449(-)